MGDFLDALLVVWAVAAWLVAVVMLVGWLGRRER